MSRCFVAQAGVMQCVCVCVLTVWQGQHYTLHNSCLLHTHIHLYSHRATHAYYTFIHTHIKEQYIHTISEKSIRTHMQGHIHKYTHAYKDTYTHMQHNTCIHTYIYTYIHTCIMYSHTSFHKCHHHKVLWDKISLKFYYIFH